MIIHIATPCLFSWYNTLILYTSSFFFNFMPRMWWKKSFCVSLCMCVCKYLSPWVSLKVSVHCICIYVSIHVPLHYLFVYMHLFTHISIIHLCICLSLCQYVSIYGPIYQPSMYLSMHPFINHPCIYYFSVHVSIHASTPTDLVPRKATPSWQAILISFLSFFLSDPKIFITLADGNEELP